jgi:plasmid stabilization system protein ParE
VKLRYTRPALADLSAILDYIAAHSPQGARQVQARIHSGTDPEAASGSLKLDREPYLQEAMIAGGRAHEVAAALSIP